MRSIFSWTLLFLLPVAASAQIPGYMGKKLSIDYSFAFSPAFRGPNSAGYAMTDRFTNNTDFFSFNGTHALSGDYVVGRRRTVGIAISSYKTQVSFSEYVVVEDASSTPYGTQIYSFTYLPGHDVNKPYYSAELLRGDMSVKGISIFTRRFSKDYIAPFGKYIKWELFALMHRTRYDTVPFLEAGQMAANNYYNFYYKYNLSKLGDGDDRFTSFGIAFELGKQRIFANSVIVNYGMRLGYVLGGFRRLDWDNTGLDELGIEKKYIKSVTTARLFRRELFSAKIGIGFLR